MIILVYLIPLTLLIVGMGLLGLFWAIKYNQYDDLEGPAERILIDNNDDIMISKAKIDD